MKTIRILVSWVGKTDLLCMTPDLSDAQKAETFRLLSERPAPAKQPGPLRTLVEHEAFDRIHLISNYPEKLNRLFAEWLGHGATVRSVEFTDPTDYPAVFREADTFLADVAKPPAGGRIDLSIHLSSGTPTMAAIWVLLGKSKYPATFFQTYAGEVRRTEIPFDLVLDYVPELLRESDQLFQHLAVRGPQDVAGFEQIVGDSKAIRLAVGRAQKAAVRDVPVLLIGESGAGKELFARAIHAAGRRHDKPFVAINCAAVPKDLLESELFGHKKGAFTGAINDHAGRFEEAAGGTLFLDEIAELDPALQSKLLRVLQPVPDGRPSDLVLQRLGETKDRRVNVRIIAATNQDLVGRMNENRFRRDLFYRLAVVTLKLPPLRHRKTDIPAIAEALLAKINEQFAHDEPGYRHKSLSAAAMQFVRTYAWPGNVRQLNSALLQAAVMSASDRIERAEIEAALAEGPAEVATRDWSEHPLGDGFDVEKHLEELHRRYLARAMQEAGGVKARAAKLLGMRNYQTLDAQLKRLGVDWKSP